MPCSSERSYYLRMARPIILLTGQTTTQRKLSCETVTQRGRGSEMLRRAIMASTGVAGRGICAARASAPPRLTRCMSSGKPGAAGGRGVRARSRTRRVAAALLTVPSPHNTLTLVHLLVCAAGDLAERRVGRRRRSWLAWFLQLQEGRAADARCGAAPAAAALPLCYRHSF